MHRPLQIRKEESQQCAVVTYPLMHLRVVAGWGQQAFTSYYGWWSYSLRNLAYPPKHPGVGM